MTPPHLPSRSNNALITSNSWGTNFTSQALETAINGLADAGGLFVCSAGNNAWNIDIPGFGFWPAKSTNRAVISVAASDRRDQMSSFSNYGRVSVDLAAPGSSILSTSFDGSGYVTMSGTSMSAPFVTGAAALLKAAVPSATSDCVRTALLRTVDPLTALTNVTVTGVWCIEQTLSTVL